MALTDHQKDLITRYKSSYNNGLSTQEASERRSDGLNTVTPPIDCPKWVCCLLPCISHIQSMKQFRLVQPEDAEVLRNKKWIRYDAASLVVGDIVRLFEGDIVPADVMVISLGAEHVTEAMESGKRASELDITVDSHFITGETKPRRIANDVNGNVEAATIYYGSRVLEGACIALVVATGKRVLLARLIENGQWPPRCDMSDEIKTEEMTRSEEGISLMSVM